MIQPGFESLQHNSIHLIDLESFTITYHFFGEEHRNDAFHSRLTYCCCCCCFFSPVKLKVFTQTRDPVGAVFFRPFLHRTPNITVPTNCKTDVSHTHTKMFSLLSLTPLFLSHSPRARCRLPRPFNCNTHTHTRAHSPTLRGRRFRG